MSRRQRYTLYGFLVAACCSLAPDAVLAHDGQPLAPHDVWQAWHWEPWTLSLLLSTGFVYGRGVRSLWRAAGQGRGIEPWRVVAFCGGLLALFVALISPLEGMAGVLFSAHMVQHLLLILVAPPLLLLGRFEVTLFWALPAARRPSLARWSRRRTVWRRIWRVLSRPWIVWILYAFGLWVWHLPALYQAALRSELVHALEHATFFGAALLWWWTLAHCHMRGSRLSYGMGILLVFTTALHGGLMGWLLTFTTQVWYPVYAETAGLWGLEPLEDQQLAGAIMWAPAGLVYAVAALLLLGVWLRGIERQGRPADGRRRPLHVGEANRLAGTENDVESVRVARAESCKDRIYEV